MLRLMLVSCALALVGGCGMSTATPQSGPPPLKAYRALWVLLAAERNEMTPDAFVAGTTSEPPQLECYPQFGTCMFEIAYRYRVGWIELSEQDQFFVRSAARGPWLSAEEIRANLTSGALDAAHIGRMHRFKKPVAFTSFEEAKAAFAARFGHAPEPGVVWRSRKTQGKMRQEWPVLEGATHDCRTEVLDLVTRDADEEADEFCFELKDPAR
jgi:hypothetical protein